MGKGPHFIDARERSRRTLMSAESARSVSRAMGVDRVRALQRVLYRCAKQDKDRRFHALYDKVARSDVLWKAWGEVRANRGAPGVDGVTIDEVVGSGVKEFLEELAAMLRSGTYRPKPRRPDQNDRPGGLDYLWFDEARADGVAHHAGGLVDAELFQDPAAVRVGGLVADAQLRGGLFGGLAVGDEHQHLPFPLREGEDDPHRLRVGDEHALLAVRDIGYGSHESGKLAIGTVARYSGALHPGIGFVGPLQPELHAEGLAGVESPQVSFHAQVPIVRVQAFHPAAASLIFGGAAAVLEPGAVHVVASGIQSGGPDHRGAGVGQDETE